MINDYRATVCCFALSIIGIIFIPMGLTEIKKLQDARKSAKIRRDSDAPDSALELPDVLKKRLSAYRQKSSERDDGDGAVSYNINEYFVFSFACGAEGGYYEGYDLFCYVL